MTQDVLYTSAVTRAVLYCYMATPIGATIVYNATDMVLSGLTMRYFHNRAVKNEKEEDNYFYYLFYSRCIGCLGGIVATHLLCKKPIHPFRAIIVNAVACVISLLMVLRLNRGYPI